MGKLKMAKGRQVVLKNEELLRRRNENKKYMLELQNDNLLLPYTLEAGLTKLSDTPKDIHGGWESPLCELRGHFLGHWLSAAAMHYEATGNEVVKAKADEIIEILGKCQLENGGKWAASIPEKYLYWIGMKKPVWAPQYTIHKTFMGLLDMYTVTGNKKALDIAVRFGEWFYEWSGRYDEDQFQDILDIETGGMLEIWVILYKITGKEMFARLMERYYRKSLFDGLLEGRDVLTNMHANTTIPEVLGAAAAYEATGEEKWLKIVEAYWQWAVTKRGMYATGGQTCGEIWSPRNNLTARLGDKNQEHCTVYNMMRLADFLFRQTKDPVYMDYWERNLYNGVMAQAYWEGSFTHGRKSEYPVTGLLTYFLPLRAGAQKAWSSRTQDFFCCHGSLVQANAALNTGIYYEDRADECGKSDESSRDGECGKSDDSRADDGIYVCQYLESEYFGEIGGKKVYLQLKKDRMNGSDHLSSDSTGTQKVSKIAVRYPDSPRKSVYDLVVSAANTEDVKNAVSDGSGNENGKFSIHIRIPAWAKGEVVVQVNGEPVEAEYKSDSAAGKFVTITREWKEDVIHMEFPKQIHVETLPGSENMTAFLDGPVVLAGLCEEERTLHTGGLKPEELLVPDNEREWGNWMNTYKTVNQERGIRFVPLYQVGYEKYAVYFPIKEK
jgi:DUF1680 family protein